MLCDLVLARVAALPEPTQRVLEVAAVAGTRVDHELLAAVVGQDTEELVWLVREAVTRHVLGVDEASGGYVFRHALVQEAIYDDLLPVQCGPLHAAYARALERRITQRGKTLDAASATAVEWGQLASHWYAAHDLGQALVASVQAGQAAESAAALAEQARDRHAEAEEQAARELAGRLVARVRAAVAAPGVTPTSTMTANLLTAEDRPGCGQPDRPLRRAGQDQLDRHDPGNHVGGRLDPGRPTVVDLRLRQLRRLGRRHHRTLCHGSLLAEAIIRGPRHGVQAAHLGDAPPVQRDGFGR